jgi:hypothetical protein
MSDLLDAALDYAQNGISIIPVWSADENGVCMCGKKDCLAKHRKFTLEEFRPTTDPTTIRGRGRALCDRAWMGAR